PHDAPHASRALRAPRCLPMADLSFRKLLSVDSEDSAEDADAEEVQLQGFVPPLLVDTQRCTMVIIMPRNKNTGGAVDHHEVVEQPYAK
ncbi:Ano10, partial [Symbiodinium pilosum]